MVDKNLPFRGETEIGKLLYNLAGNIHRVVPQSIVGETPRAFINDEMFRELWGERIAPLFPKPEYDAVICAIMPYLCEGDLERTRNAGCTQEYYERVGVREFISAVFYSGRTVYLSEMQNAVRSLYVCVDADTVLDAVGQEPRTPHGRFAKRVQSWLYKSYQFKVPSEMLTEIGNIYNLCLLGEHEMFVAITNNFNWQDGEFGKEDSCWWGCHKNSRDTLYSAGGYGALFYGEDGDLSDNDTGKGRFWLAPISDELIIGFNPYGGRGQEYAACIAKLMEKVTGKRWIYGKRYFRNRCSSTIPYINGDNLHNNDGGSRVYAIYTGERPPETITVRWEEDAGIFSEDDRPVCSYCGERRDEDDIVGTDNNGEAVCRGCAEEMYQCRHCDHYFDDEAHNYPDHSGSYCYDCYRRLSEAQCHECGQLFYYSDSAEYVNEHAYCEGCVPEREEESNEE